MRIIFLDAVQNFGGSQKSTINLIKNIKDKHDILYVDFWGSDNLLIDKLKDNHIKYIVLDKRKEPIIINERKKLHYKLKNLLKLTINFFKLKKEINKLIFNFKPDLVVVNNIKSLSILNKKKDVNIIYFERTWFAPQKITILKKYFLSRVNYFFAVSNATKHAIYSKGLASLDKVYVLPNSIKLENPYKQVEKPFNKLKILNCGGYIKTKGLHHTLIVAKKLRDSGVDFQIDIVGALYKGESSLNYYNELEVYIKQNNLEEFVFLHKNIKNMSPFFEKADVLIHPTYAEGLPRVIMEAMANSVPVIANSVGGVNDYILDGFTGFLADFNNVDKFFDKINVLKNDLKVYNFVTKNAYSLIEKNYNDNVQKNNIEDIFKKLR